MHKQGTLLFLVAILCVVNVAVWTVLTFQKRSGLEVIFLDVGQGDAILIKGPHGAEVLIDGGPDRSILRVLPKELGPIDRTLDLVIATHPDKDHIAGLSEVLARYDVAATMDPDVENDTSFAQSFNARTLEERALTIPARRGTRIHLGGGAYLDVLFPDRSVDTVESNTGSIVARAVYGETSFLLTGDAPVAVESWLAALDGNTLKSTVVKAGHHGSRTSTSAEWLRVTDPEYVVVSAGKDNSYGHPHEEVVAAIVESGAQMVGTLGEGPVTFISDGTTVQLK
ncbi:MAG TPA: MBL fold metallo-hydrolase [Candidatus Paceibacterota bacterium]|nr:MBL fold metallo-hydrolase [Candidatus Paceibacterota bacterium]